MWSKVLLVLGFVLLAGAGWLLFRLVILRLTQD
jgi:hypothetical protein